MDAIRKFLEHFFVPAFVWVVFVSEFPVGALNIRVRCVFAYTKYFIKIVHVCCDANILIHTNDTNNI